MFFISLCSYFVVIYDNTIRTVEFLSIFAPNIASPVTTPKYFDTLLPSSVGVVECII